MRRRNVTQEGVLGRQHGIYHYLHWAAFRYVRGGHLRLIDRLIDFDRGIFMALVASSHILALAGFFHHWGVAYVCIALGGV